MRVIVFFDLPMDTLEEKRIYRRFRKTLIKHGFFMMQESVYTKMITNQSVESSIKNVIMKNKPEKGIVQIITVTEKQFSKMEYIVGESSSTILDTQERLVIL